MTGRGQYLLVTQQHGAALGSPFGWPAIPLPLAAQEVTPNLALRAAPWRATQGGSATHPTLLPATSSTREVATESVPPAVKLRPRGTTHGGDRPSVVTQNGGVSATVQEATRGRDDR